MPSGSTAEEAIDTLARNRIVEYLRGRRRGSRSVVTLVDIPDEMAMDPETVEMVMTQLERTVDTPVRRATADQLRWPIR